MSLTINIVSTPIDFSYSRKQRELGEKLTIEEVQKRMALVRSLLESGRADGTIEKTEEEIQQAIGDIAAATGWISARGASTAEQQLAKKLECDQCQELSFDLRIQSVGADDSLESALCADCWEQENSVDSRF